MAAVRGQGTGSQLPWEAAGLAVGRYSSGVELSVTYNSQFCIKEIHRETSTEKEMHLSCPTKRQQGTCCCLSGSRVG